MYMLASNGTLGIFFTTGSVYKVQFELCVCLSVQIVLIGEGQNNSFTWHCEGLILQNQILGGLYLINLFSKLPKNLAHLYLKNHTIKNCFGLARHLKWGFFFKYTT